MTLLRRRPLVTFVMLAGWLGVAAPASAQQGWTQGVTDLSPPVAESDWIGFGAIGADGSENVRAIWSERIGDGIHSVVRTTRRSAEAGVWSEPAEAYRTSLMHGVVCVQLVVDVAGNATASCAENSAALGSTFALRYSVATDTWTPEEIERGIGLALPHLAMDVAGNTYAVWSSTTLRLRRHTASTDTWSPIVELPFVGFSPRVAADQEGNLFLAWLTTDAMQITINGAHYEAATGRWSGIAGIPAPRNSVGAVQVAVDRTGHAMVVWAQWAAAGAPSVVRAARYSALTGSWGLAIDISTGAAAFSDPQLVIDDEGNALAGWHARYSGFTRVESALFAASTGIWSTVTNVSGTGIVLGGPQIVSDTIGNVTIVWHVISGTESVLRAARYKKAAGTFGAPVAIARVISSLGRLSVVADGVGSATVVWHQHIGTQFHVQTTRWEATPPAPAVTLAVPEAGALRVHVTPPQTLEADFQPTNYEYSPDDAATWTLRAPASTTSPLEIVGLGGGTTYQLRVRAVNRAGAGAASASFPVTLPAAPDPPVNFAVTSIAGDRVTVGWAPPTGETLPEGYGLEGGVQPGEVLATLPTGSTAPTFTFMAPAGVFYVRLRAYAGASWSAASNEVRISVNVAVAPSAPAHLLGLVSGSAVALSWMNTTDGGAPTSLWLSVSGGWNGTVPVPMGETFVLDGVPAGTYTLSLSAANAAGVSQPSNAVTLTLPGVCSGMPGAPRDFVAFATGRTISARWDAPASGAAVTGYTVLVTGADVWGFPTTERFLSGPAAPGSYSLRVVATNFCGTSAPTPAQTVTIR